MSGKSFHLNLKRGGIIIFVTCGLSSLVAARASGDFDDAFRAMKRDEKLQFELPPAPEPPKLDWLTRLVEAIAGFIDFILPLLKIIFFMGIGIVVALIFKTLTSIAPTPFAAH